MREDHGKFGYKVHLLNLATYVLSSTTDITEVSKLPEQRQTPHPLALNYVPQPDPIIPTMALTLHVVHQPAWECSHRHPESHLCKPIRYAVLKYKI